MSGNTLAEIQHAIAIKAKQNPNLLDGVPQGHSATLWLALGERGFELPELESYTVHSVEQLAARILGLSNTHCALIRVADWDAPFGGIAYLDADLAQLGITAAYLRDFWWHLDTLEYEHWRSIAKAASPSAIEWRQAWIRTAQKASTWLPGLFYLAGQAAVEVSHEPGTDLLHSCIMAKHRATIEIIAAAAPDAAELNYLGLFGFSTLSHIPRTERPRHELNSGQHD